MVREFSASCRAASAAARVRATAARAVAREQPNSDLAVYVSRDPGVPQRYLFEIRRFGGVRIYISQHNFAQPAEAQAAETAVLEQVCTAEAKQLEEICRG